MGGLELQSLLLVGDFNGSVDVDDGLHVHDDKCRNVRSQKRGSSGVK